MKNESHNPFSVTKAVDLSDEQIRDTWVDLPGDASLMSLVSPTSPMPVLLLGGKGSGRTHLLRYFSYPVQLLRYRGEAGGIRQGFRRDGYVGVFVECEGLRTGRFVGKVLSEEQWFTIFVYFFDLWLAQLALETLQGLLTNVDIGLSETKFANDVASLCDMEGVESPQSLSDVRRMLGLFQNEVDRAVDNAPLSRCRPEVRIRSSRGRLVLDIPRLFWRNCNNIEGFSLLYLIDEVENLSIEYQKYINTLVREKRHPVSFRIGCRTHGFRTLETLAAGEVNRNGSEFERVDLDAHFRRSQSYPSFTRRMVGKRLSGSLMGDTDDKELRMQIDSGFKNIDPEQLAFVKESYSPESRPYLRTLRSRLHDSSSFLIKNGLLENTEQIEQLVSAIRVDDLPLLERANVFLLYQRWYRKERLADAAAEIRASSERHLTGEDNGSSDFHTRIFGHFRQDLIAQIVRECRRPQRYIGMDSFVRMSGGFPRHLLIILKAVYRWATFNGEQPFTKRGGKQHWDPISVKSQTQGVLQASNWFYEDARVIGHDTTFMQRTVDRLGEFFRTLRYSDKPVLPSLITFAYDPSVLSSRAKHIIEGAVQSSLLLRVPEGHKNSNRESVDAALQLNPMLSPRFDLPLARRGVIELSQGEMEALVVRDDDAFRSVLRARVNRMNAPFSAAEDDKQQSLF